MTYVRTQTGTFQERSENISQYDRPQPQEIGSSPVNKVFPFTDIETKNFMTSFEEQQ